MMGVGKTTLGKKLAAKLDWESVDLDHVIEESSGMTIPEIFEQEGETSFREREEQALMDVVGRNNIVVSVGGGTPAHSSNAERMLESGLCVWMDAPTGMLVHRLVHAHAERPLLAGLSEDQIASRIEALMEERQSYFAKAHLILSMNNQSSKDAVATLASIIQGRS